MRIRRGCLLATNPRPLLLLLEVVLADGLKEWSVVADVISTTALNLQMFG